MSDDDILAFPPPRTERSEWVRTEVADRLRAELAAERERADYAWKNTRLIDADRQRVTEERDGLRADLAALRAENEALRDDCSRLASYNAEESAHLRTRLEKAEAEAARLLELLTHEQRGEGINAARAVLKEVQS